MVDNYTNYIRQKYSGTQKEAALGRVLKKGLKSFNNSPSIGKNLAGTAKKNPSGYFSELSNSGVGALKKPKFAIPAVLSGGGLSAGAYYSNQNYNNSNNNNWSGDIYKKFLQGFGNNY